jgi:multiple sugar transport system permease protein
MITAVASQSHGRRRRPRARWAGSWQRGHGLTALVFLAPALIGFTAFYLVPTVRGLWFSFTDYNLLSEPEFVGLDNYGQALGDEVFWNALQVTGVYVVLNIAPQTVLALALATILDRLTRSVVIRSLVLLPWLVPNVTIALLWMWLLDSNLGFVNHILEQAAMAKQGFLFNPDQSIATIASVNTWRHVGYTALLLFAGMQLIPKNLYEAGKIDGAGEWRMFRSITLPLMRPVLALVLVVSLIGSFQIFDTVAVTTEGGPVNASRVIYYYIYEKAFTQFEFGYASAMAVFLILFLVALTLLQMRLLRASTSDLS